MYRVAYGRGECVRSPGPQARGSVVMPQRITCTCDTPMHVDVNEE